MSTLLYLTIGGLAVLASLAIVAAMAVDDVDHLTDPDPEHGGTTRNTAEQPADGDR